MMWGQVWGLNFCCSAEVKKQERRKKLGPALSFPLPLSSLWCHPLLPYLPLRTQASSITLLKLPNIANTNISVVAIQKGP